MIEAAGSAVAKSVVSAATKPIWSRLSAATLGTPEERALASVYRRAVDHAVRDTSGGKLSDDLVDLAESQFCRLLAMLPQSEVARLGEPSGYEIPAVVREWRRAAEALDIDTTTMAVDFDQTAAALLRYLPLELAEASGQAGSALTARRMVDTVGAVRAMLDGLINSYAGTIEIDPALLKAMKAAERTCHAVGRSLHRPDMLYALLRMPSSAVADALNTAGVGTAATLRDRLAKGEPGPSGQSAVLWHERPELMVARRAAVLGGSPAVTDLCLLLAFLDDSCDSLTMTDLRAGLGMRLDDVRRATRRMVSRSRPAPTPASYLDGWHVN